MKECLDRLFVRGIIFFIMEKGSFFQRDVKGIDKIDRGF